MRPKPYRKRGHGEQQPVVFRIGPIEGFGQGIGGYRILEAPSVGVSGDHGFKKCLVDHIHLFPAIPISEVLGFASDDGRKVLQVVWYGPVQRDVGEWGLGTPA